MQRDIRPSWLIRLAEELAGLGAGQGQPRNTNLRRAVSTAYYALFHRISLATARSVLPNGTDAEVYGIARHIKHEAIRQCADYVAGQSPPKHLDEVILRLRQNNDLSVVTSNFVDLQQRREEADYDHLADFTRPDVLASVVLAKRSSDITWHKKTTDDFRAFFGLIALRTTLRR